jgi:heme iron utilization protein
MSYDRAAAHMNDDHADSLVLIARAYGSVPTATSARIVTLEDSGMDLEVEVEDGATRHTRVPFNPPIEEGEVRERMVQLAQRAGEAQGKNLGDHR